MGSRASPAAISSLGRQSPILESVLHFCNAAGENEVLGRVLLRLAESGRCDEASPLFEEF